MMSLAPIILLITASGILCVGGCASTGSATLRPLAVAVAVSPVGVRTITAEQVAQIHEALRPELHRAGYTLAQSSASADLVLVVSFTPIPGGNGGRVQVTGLEPTAQFRRATDEGDTPEAKEMRRRQREFEQWVERQGRSYEY